MNVYFDAENLVSLYKQRKSSATISDGIKLLKRHCSLFFNFSNKFDNNNPLSLIIKDFNEGVGEGKKHSFNDDIFPERPLKGNFHTKVENKQSIFFINGDIQKAKIAGSLLIVDIGEEELLFEKLTLFNNEYRFERSLTIGSPELDSWSCLEKFSLPLTDLIVFDRWLFENRELLVSNFEYWLNIIHSNTQIKTNIIIVTNPDKRDKNLNLLELTRKTLNTRLGKSPNVTLIDIRGYTDGKPKSKEKKTEHDRTIITNYIRFKSGDSFNYFNSKEEVITDGSELDIKSLIHSENNSKALQIILNLQKTIIYLEEKNPDAIQGDKKSNFLTFKI